MHLNLKPWPLPDFAATLGAALVLVAVEVFALSLSPSAAVAGCCGAITGRYLYLRQPRLSFSFVVVLLFVVVATGSIATLAFGR